MPTSLKPLLLLGLAFFLYGRLSDGTILFYVNRRFVWLMWLAVAMLLFLVASYRADRRAWHYARENHAHTVPWRTAALVLLPVLLGLLVPPKALDTAALANRELNTALQTALTVSSARVRQATEQKPPTVLDWVLAFGETSEPATFAGKSTDLTGFVYRRADLPSDAWLLSRFVVTCCVADATAIGIAVRAPGMTPPGNDQWMRVQGHFDVGIVGGEQVPVLIADTVTPVDPPAQPYLYLR